jgi:hypothetical protein
MSALDSRPLDPAERYFFLLDRLWPMNIVAIAELDTTPDEARVRAAWEAVAAGVPLARSRIRGGPGLELMLESSEDVPLDVGLAAGPWEVAVKREQEIPFAASVGPLMRVRYIAGTDGEAALALVVHHAVADARSALWLLQELIREVAGDASSSAPAKGLPLPLHDTVVPAHRWAENRQGMVRLLRDLREERDRSDPPSRVPWHARAVDGRDPQLDHICFSRAETAEIVDKTRGVGATVNGALSAAWLLAVAALLDGDHVDPTVALATPADLRTRLVPPVTTREPGMYITLLTTTHRVHTGAFVETARAISEEIRSRLARGEGELFYALTRPGAVPPDEQGLARFRQLIDTAPQAIAVSNAGIVDDTGDPKWVRSLSFVLAPTPNQVAFAAATTYRGRLVVNLATDSLRVDASVARRLADEATAHLR